MTDYAPTDKLLPAHRVTEQRDSPLWLAGLAACLALIALLGLLNHLDDKLAATERQRAQLAQELAQARTLLDAPAVRLVAAERGGFECTAWKVREAWIGQAAQRCEQLGQFLTMAQRID